MFAEGVVFLQPKEVINENPAAKLWHSPSAHYVSRHMHDKRRKADVILPKLDSSSDVLHLESTDLTKDKKTPNKSDESIAIISAERRYRLSLTHYYHPSRMSI